MQAERTTIRLKMAPSPNRKRISKAIARPSGSKHTAAKTQLGGAGFCWQARSRGDALLDCLDSNHDGQHQRSGPQFRQSASESFWRAWLVASYGSLYTWGRSGLHWLSRIVSGNTRMDRTGSRLRCTDRVIAVSLYRVLTVLPVRQSARWPAWPAVAPYLVADSCCWGHLGPPPPPRPPGQIAWRKIPMAHLRTRCDPSGHLSSVGLFG